MEEQLNKAFQLVGQSNNAAIKQGEHLLGLLKKDTNYPIALLCCMNNSQQQVNKLRAAIELKLWAESYKGMEEYEQNSYGGVIDTIKDSIIHAYLNFPSPISKNLLPAIVSLAEVLFPDHWGSLVIFLMNYASQNNAAISAVIVLLEEMTHKYTTSSRSDPLYAEIIKVCNELHDFFKQLTSSILQTVISDPSSNAVGLLQSLMKLFYNLNYQDLHPKFEDDLPFWMSVLKAVMKLPNSNEMVFKCKGAALEAILLYANKYKEDVEQSIRDFCVEIWPMCANASEDPEYDPIVFNCLKFFKSLLNWSDMKGFFLSNIDQFFENLILPNIGLTKTALGQFEDEPEIFIDYYFRNSEMMTRRAAAIELLRIICRSYGSAFPAFAQKHLNSFMNLPSKNAADECTILGLVIDGSSKGFRDVDGCTQLFVEENIIHFCYNNIVKNTLGAVFTWAIANPQRVVEDQFNPLHLAIILRFLFYFRIYFPKQELASILQCVSKLRSKKASLRRAVQITISGYIIIKHGDYETYRNLTPFFTPDNLRPLAVDILTLIYQSTIEEDFLQQGLTKIFLHLSKQLQHANCQFFSYEAEIIKQMLARTERFDFSSAQFLFQAIGYLAYNYIRANSPDKGALEQLMLNFFQQALKSKSDLLNFCLQVMSIYLQLQSNPSGQYRLIYESLLLQQNWKQENLSVMSSYVQFITAFLQKHRERIVSDRPALEVILTKIIQIDHVELFYRFLDSIMHITTLEEFANAGYLNILVCGSQKLSASLQGRKSTLLFISRALHYYAPHSMRALHMLNNVCSKYYDQLLAASGDILRSISVRRQRKFIISAICMAIDNNYFDSVELEGGILNELITNTTERFKLTNLGKASEENERREKKEATYRKLMVFKEMEKPEEESQVDDEELLVRTFRQAVTQRNVLLQFVSEKSKDRMMRLSDKYNR